MSDTPITDQLEENFGEMPGALKRMEKENATLRRKLDEAEKERDEMGKAVASIIPHLKYIVEWDGGNDRWEDPGYASAEALAIVQKALRKRGDAPCRMNTTSPVSDALTDGPNPSVEGHLKEALRAAGELADGLEEALDVVHDQTDELLTGAEEALAKYRALTADGPTETKS